MRGTDLDTCMLYKMEDAWMVLNAFDSTVRVSRYASRPAVPECCYKGTVLSLRPCDASRAYA